MYHNLLVLFMCPSKILSQWHFLHKQCDKPLFEEFCIFIEILQTIQETVTVFHKFFYDKVLVVENQIIHNILFIIAYKRKIFQLNLVRNQIDWPLLSLWNLLSLRSQFSISSSLCRSSHSKIRFNARLGREPVTIPSLRLAVKFKTCLYLQYLFIHTPIASVAGCWTLLFPPP